MSLHISIVHNTAVQFIGKILSTLIGLIILGTITRYLGQEVGFGQYTTVMAYLQFAGILADFGLSLVFVQMLAEDQEHEESLASHIFTFRLLTALCIFLGSIIFAYFLPYDAAIRGGIAIVATSFFAMNCNQVLIGVFQLKLAMHRATISEIISRLILLFGTLLVVKQDLGLSTLFMVQSLVGAAHLGMNLFWTRTWMRITLAYERAIWRKIWKKCWPIALSIFFNLLYFKADTLVLSLTQSLGDTGLYGAAYKVLEVLITVPFMFLGLLLPFFTSYWKQKTNMQFHSMAQNAFDVMSICALPMVIGGWVLGRKIMALVAGEEFLLSGDILKILVIATGCIFLSNVFTHIIVAIDAQRKILPGFAFVAILALIGYIIFIPLYSYLAAAWITVFAEGMIMLIAAGIVYRLTNFVPRFKTFIKASFASIMMGGLLMMIQPINPSLFWEILLGGVVYLGMIILLKAVPMKLLREIVSWR